MTRPNRRRDKDVRDSSVIAGLRMEPELAQALVNHARDLAEQLGLQKANVAATTRHLLRVALGWNENKSLAAEERFREIAETKRQLYE